MSSWQEYLDAANRKVQIAEFHLKELRKSLSINNTDHQEIVPPIPIQAHFEGVIIAVIAAIDQTAQAANSALSLHLTSSDLIEKAFASLSDLLPEMKSWYMRPIGRDLRRIRTRMIHYSYKKKPQAPCWHVEKATSQYTGSRELQLYSETAVNYGMELTKLLVKIEQAFAQKIDGKGEEIKRDCVVCLSGPREEVIKSGRNREQKGSKIESAIILGAGFSNVAGLPLTRQLFNPKKMPTSVSESSAKSDQAVMAAYREWEKKQDHPNAEEWLGELYKEKDNKEQCVLQGTTWNDAVRFALRTLVHLPKKEHASYYYGICTYECHPIHQQFWIKVEEELGAKVILTMNYDILAEQALHKEKGCGTVPAYYYGGFQYIQAVRKMTDVVKRDYELVEHEHEMVLFKLHGSLNWAWEEHSPALKIHNDVRAVFRHGDSVGVPAIIPPIPEKEMPLEFSQIWYQAEKSLMKCDNWVVCGYSLPPYDYALRDYFKRILSSRKLTRIVILDPNSKDIEKRWQALSPGKVITKNLSGIPDAFSDSWLGPHQEELESTPELSLFS